jgi:hypothetical protein
LKEQQQLFLRRCCSSFRETQRLGLDIAFFAYRTLWVRSIIQTTSIFQGNQTGKARPKKTCLTLTFRSPYHPTFFGATIDEK